jgi:hypothetical protein
MAEMLAVYAVRYMNFSRKPTFPMTGLSSPITWKAMNGILLLELLLSCQLEMMQLHFSANWAQAKLITQILLLVSQEMLWSPTPKELEHTWLTN